MKTDIRSQMDAEKPDDVLASLEAKYRAKKERDEKRKDEAWEDLGNTLRDMARGDDLGPREVVQRRRLKTKIKIMIETKKAVIHIASDGAEFKTLEEAKLHELGLLFPGDKTIAPIVLAVADRIVDILTTKERSRPRARKINSGSGSGAKAKKEVAAALGREAKK